MDHQNDHFLDAVDRYVSEEKTVADATLDAFADYVASWIVEAAEPLDWTRPPLSGIIVFENKDIQIAIVGTPGAPFVQRRLGANTGVEAVRGGDLQDVLLSAFTPADFMRTLRALLVTTVKNIPARHRGKLADVIATLQAAADKLPTR